MIKHIVAIAVLVSAGWSSADTNLFVETWPLNSIRFQPVMGWMPSSMPALSSLPNSQEDVGPEYARFDRRFTKLLLDRPDFRVYFVEPNPEDGECGDASTVNGSSRVYVHPAGKFVEYPIPLNCQEPNYVYPEDVDFAIYEIESRIYIELAWPAPASPKFILLEVTAEDVVEVDCNDC